LEKGPEKFENAFSFELEKKSILIRLFVKNIVGIEIKLIFFCEKICIFYD